MDKISIGSRNLSAEDILHVSVGQALLILDEPALAKVRGVCVCVCARVCVCYVCARMCVRVLCVRAPHSP